MLFKAPPLTPFPWLSGMGMEGEWNLGFETLSERIPYIYISKQPSLRFVAFELLHSCVIHWWLFCEVLLALIFCFVSQIGFPPSCVTTVGICKSTPNLKISTTLAVLVFSFQHLKCQRKQTNDPRQYKQTVQITAPSSKGTHFYV